MRKEEKIETASALAQKLSKAKAIILAEYTGLKVSEVTEIRKALRKNTSELKVVKNRLVKKAAEGSPWSVLDAHLKGPLALAISDHDPVMMAKVLAKSAETYEAFKIKAGCLDGKLLTKADIDALSKLPSKEELYAKLLGTLMAPASGLVRVLQGVPQKLAIALKAIADKKQS